MPTPLQIVNEAMQLMGNNAPAVTGAPPNFDDSAGGKAAALLYAPTVATVARSFGWDFARHSAALVATVNPNPPMLGFTNEYLYPAEAVEIMQVRRPTITDPYNPLPVNYLVGNVTIGGLPKKVIWTDFAGAIAVYNNNPHPDLWDAGFHQAVIRLLANCFDLAIAGKPEAAQLAIENYGKFQAAAETRDA